jgi:hypothetical protein
MNSKDIHTGETKRQDHIEHIPAYHLQTHPDTEYGNHFTALDADDPQSMRR